MLARPSLVVIVSAVSAFTPIGHAETLIAAGRMREANVALAKIEIEQAEGFARNGIAPNDLGVYLSARYPAAADQTYLHSTLAKLSDKTTRVKMRALDKTAQGYVMTAPNGMLLKIGYRAKGQIMVNGHALNTGSLEASVEGVRRALEKKMVRLTWPALFGVPSADAATAIEYLMIAALIAVGIITVLRTGPPLLAATGATPAPKHQDLRITLAEYWGQAVRQCKTELAEHRLRFEQSLTGKFGRFLEERNVVSLTAATRPAECATAVENFYKENWEAKGGFARGDIKAACARLDEFLGCVKEYRTVPLPQASTPRVSGSGTETPSQDTTPAQPASATSPESAR